MIFLIGNRIEKCATVTMNPLNPSITMPRIKQLITSYPKWLVLALTAAIGCFTAALILGEPFLALTRKLVPPSPPIQPQSICLTIDVSGSMFGAKLEEMKNAAGDFIDRRDLSMDQFALVTFSSAASIGFDFSQDAPMLEVINSLFAEGNTNFEAAMQKSAEILRAVPGDKNIVLFTDGANTEGDRYRAINIAENLRSQGVNIFAIATGDANTWFLSSLTGSWNRVIWAQTGEFGQAFAKAEEMIYSKGLMESGGAYTFQETLVRVCVWTAFLCFGISLFIKMVQNILMQQKRMIRITDFIVILVTTAIVGIIAGGCGQILYGLFSFVGFLYADRIIAWALLGLISAYGLSLFIPNLNKDWAWRSGAFGGLLGAICFIYLTQILGDIGGRLIGAFILGFFIGLMVGVIETVFRNAFLKINYSSKESTTLNLGGQIVTLGSGHLDTVYVSDVAEKAMSFQLDKGKLLCYKNGQLQNINAGDKLTLGDVTVEVCDGYAGLLRAQINRDTKPR
jgi:Ca-activated chloride channel family protein